MADDSTQLTKQEAAKSLWEEATHLPEGQNCDMMFCPSARGTELSVGDAWRQISTNQALSRIHYVDTCCLRKAVEDEAWAAQHAVPVDTNRNVRSTSNMNSLMKRDDRVSQGLSVETPTLPRYSAQSGSPN